MLAHVNSQRFDDNAALSYCRRVCARCQCVSALGWNLNLIELDDLSPQDFTLPHSRIFSSSPTMIIHLAT